MFCERCTYFAPCRGSALLRRLRLGWCMEPGRMWAGLARHGHAPFRAGWLPCCREFHDLNNNAPRSGAGGGHRCDCCRGTEPRGAATTREPKAAAERSAKHDLARETLTPTQPRTEIPDGADTEAQPEALASRAASAGPACGMGRCGRRQGEGREAEALADREATPGRGDPEPEKGGAE